MTVCTNDLHEMYAPSARDQGLSASDNVGSAAQSYKLTDEDSDDLSTVLRRNRLTDALSAKFKMPMSGWQNCNGAACSPGQKGVVIAVFDAPKAREDKLEEVFAHMDKVFRAADISKIIIKGKDAKTESTYHVVPIADAPEPVELLAPLTVTSLDVESRKSKDNKDSPGVLPVELSWTEEVTTKILRYVEKPLMVNLIAAFERKQLSLDKQNLAVDHKQPDFHFYRAIVQLRLHKPITAQLKSLHLIATANAKSDCQRDKTNRLIHVLEILSAPTTLTKIEATRLARDLNQDLPDDLYRLQALNDLALKSNVESLPGMTDSDTEKDMLHSMATILFLSALTISSPIFAFILVKKLLEKNAKSGEEKEELSSVTYGWKRMSIVIASLFVSLLLVIVFEFASGFASETGTAVFAIFHPIARVLSDLVASIIYNLPILLVFFVWSIPEKISFSEAFGLRFKTQNYSFKNLCVFGVVAYLALNAVTTMSMVMMVIYHHPDTISDGSSGIATALSMGAAALMFFTESIFGPFLEELCFRGVLYRGLRASWGILPSLIVSSLWFAVLHNEFAPWLLFHKFAVGAVNALLYEKTRSLVPSIIAHSLNNIFLDLA